MTEKNVTKIEVTKKPHKTYYTKKELDCECNFNPNNRRNCNCYKVCNENKQINPKHKFPQGKPYNNTVVQSYLHEPYCNYNTDRKFKGYDHFCVCELYECQAAQIKGYENNCHLYHIHTYNAHYKPKGNGDKEKYTKVAQNKPKVNGDKENQQRNNNK